MLLSYQEALEYELEILAELLENTTDTSQQRSIIEMMVAMTKYLNQLERKLDIC